MFDRHFGKLARGGYGLLTPDDIAIMAIELLTLCGAVWGTWRFAVRLWRASPSTRLRAVVWSLIPLSVGGFLGYLEGSEKGLLAGLFLTATIAVFVLCIATALWIPQFTRRLLGTALFEAAALLIWAFLGAFWGAAYA